MRETVRKVLCRLMWEGGLASSLHRQMEALFPCIVSETAMRRDDWDAHVKQT